MDDSCAHRHSYTGSFAGTSFPRSSPQSEKTTGNTRTIKHEVKSTKDKCDLRKPQLRPIPLLRPILAFCTHNHLLGLAETYFASLLEPFKVARLPCSLEIWRYSNLEAISRCNTPAELLAVLLTTPESTLTLSLPADSSLSLQIRTPYQSSQTTYQWVHPFYLR